MKYKVTKRLLKAKVKQWRHVFPALPGVTVSVMKPGGDYWGMAWALDNGGALIEISPDVPEDQLDAVVMHELVHCVEIAQTGEPDPNHGPSFQQTRARILQDTGIDIGT